MDTIVEFCKLRFLMQPLQNLLLCSSTARATMDGIPFAILNSSNFKSDSPIPSVSSGYKLGKTAIGASHLVFCLCSSNADREDYYKFIEPPAQISFYFYMPFPSWLKYILLKGLKRKMQDLILFFVM
jgi:hypothetical protein